MSFRSGYGKKIGKLVEAQEYLMRTRLELHQMRKGRLFLPETDPRSAVLGVMDDRITNLLVAMNKPNRF